MNGPRKRKTKSQAIEDRNRGLYNITMFYMPFFLGMPYYSQALPLYLFYRTKADTDHRVMCGYDEMESIFFADKENGFPKKELKQCDIFLSHLGLISFVQNLPPDRYDEKCGRVITFNPALMDEALFRKICKALRESSHATVKSDFERSHENIILFREIFRKTFVPVRYSYDDLFDKDKLIQIRRMQEDNEAGLDTICRSLGLNVDTAKQHIADSYTGGRLAWEGLLRRTHYHEKENMGLIKQEDIDVARRLFRDETDQFEICLPPYRERWTPGYLYGFYSQVFKECTGISPNKSPIFLDPSKDIKRSQEWRLCHKLITLFVNNDNRYFKALSMGEFITAEWLPGFIEYSISKMIQSHIVPTLHLIVDESLINDFQKYMINRE